MLFTKEHYEIMAMFEAEYRKHGSFRWDKEDKAMWAHEVIYQSGELNSLFLAYRRGYAMGKAS